MASASEGLGVWPEKYSYWQPYVALLLESECFAVHIFIALGPVMSWSLADFRDMFSIPWYKVFLDFCFKGSNPFNNQTLVVCSFTCAYLYWNSNSHSIKQQFKYLGIYVIGYLFAAILRIEPKAAHARQVLHHWTTPSALKQQFTYRSRTKICVSGTGSLCLRLLFAILKILSWWFLSCLYILQKNNFFLLLYCGEIFPFLIFL